MQQPFARQPQPSDQGLSPHTGICIQLPHTVVEEGPSTVASSALETVRAHLAAEDRRDLDATMATFTAGCWYAIPSQDYLLKGRDAVRAHYAGLFRTFPDLVNEEVALHDAGDRVFASITVRRHFRGTWGPFAPTGEEIVTHALAEFPLAPDGLLEAEIVHINPLEALEQIGVVPTRSVLRLAELYQRAAGTQA